MTLWKWSTDPATNGSADSACPFPEGMAPSQVNDSARGIMAAAAKYRDDISGKIVTGGTSTAYTVTSNQVFDTLAHLDGAMIAFVPHADCGATPTLNVDGLGAKTIRGQSGVDLIAGSLMAGTHYVATYNNSSGEFVLHNFNPGGIPIGCGMEYWGSTVPSSNFVFAYGQAISRTDYPICFARLGTTHGSGDGSTTFNLPDKRGRASAGKDDMGGSAANRLSGGAPGVDGSTLGASGGEQTQTLVTSQIPVHSHANTLNDPGHSHSINAVASDVSNTFGGQGALTVPRVFAATMQAATTGITITNVNAGSGGAHNNVQPTIVCNYIIRVK
jgi:microcystin-dependent protein